MPVRTAEAEWLGRLRDGKGTMHFDAYDGPYSFASRFEEGQGTNPEELIGAAHAGCFSMALSAELEKAGYSAVRVHTVAKVHLDPAEGITAIDLQTDATVPGIENAAFLHIANQAKVGCPVSKALAAIIINLDARLVE